MKTKEEFIISSISDIQNTIRALDAKFFGSLVLFLLPFTEFETISKAFRALYNDIPKTTCLLIVLMVLVWIIGLLLSFFGIYSIENPSKKLKVNSNNNIVTKGFYYNADLFDINFFKTIFPKSILSKKDIDEMVLERQIGESEIFNELVFEQAKLTYIRDIKIKRQKYSIIFLVISLIIISAVLIVSKL